MDKYLGNKRSLVDAIYDFVHVQCPDASTLCDIFSGTTNVGRYFRRRGFRVYSNDANRFSYVLGSAYLTLDHYPRYHKVRPVSLQKSHAIYASLRRNFLSAIKKDRDQLFPSSKAEETWEQLEPCTSVICHLNASQPSPDANHIVEHFTAFGRRSSFRSLRGTVGKRNYFSLENAKRLDSILSQVRHWWINDCLSPTELYLLMTSILEEVVIVANVNGTFHDFNRDRLWPNALQNLFLRVPLVHVDAPSGSVFCQDALKLASHLPPHDILYIDPPYNFRQYAAYYHFLNFIAAYPFLDNIDEYLNSIEYVRGQNMQDDFTSAFCFRDRFMEALDELIESTPCRYVVMSYYGGRNHWNHWSRGSSQDDLGLLQLKSYFEAKGRFKRTQTLPVLQIRKNYQSRIGEKKQLVNEHLFFAERATSPKAPARRVRSVLMPNNTRFDLQAFGSFNGSHIFNKSKRHSVKSGKSAVV